MISRLSYMSNFQRVFVVAPGESAVEYQNARDARNQYQSHTKNIPPPSKENLTVQKPNITKTTPTKVQPSVKEVRKPLKIFNKRNALLGAAGLAGLWGLSSLHESLTNPNKYMNTP